MSDTRTKSADKIGSHVDRKLKSMLQEDEKLLRVATIHPGIYWKSFAVLLIGIWLFFVVRNLGIFLLIVCAISFAFAHLTKHYLLLALTDRRVMVRRGIIHLDIAQVHHNRIESVELSRSIVGRILGYATVIVSGTGSRIMAVPFVRDGAEFRSDLDKILLAREDIHNRTVARGDD